MDATKFSNSCFIIVISEARVRGSSFTVLSISLPLPQSTASPSFSPENSYPASAVRLTLHPIKKLYIVSSNPLPTTPSTSNSHNMLFFPFFVASQYQHRSVSLTIQKRFATKLLFFYINLYFTPHHKPPAHQNQIFLQFQSIL